MPLGYTQNQVAYSINKSKINNGILYGKHSNQRAYITLDNSIPYYGENALNNNKLKTTNLAVKLRYSVKHRVVPWYKLTCDIITNGDSATLRLKNYKDMLEQAKTNEVLAYLIKYVPQLNEKMFEIAKHNPNLTFMLSLDYEKIVKDKKSYNFCEVTDVILKSMKKYDPKEYEFLVNERGYPEV